MLQLGRSWLTLDCLVHGFDDNFADVFSTFNPPISLAKFRKGIVPIDNWPYFMHCHRFKQGFEILRGANGTTTDDE